MGSQSIAGPVYQYLTTQDLRLYTLQIAALKWLRMACPYTVYYSVCIHLEMQFNRAGVSNLFGTEGYPKIGE